MRCRVLETLRVKTVEGVREVLPGQIIDLSFKKAMPFVQKGKITPIADTAIGSDPGNVRIKIRSEVLSEDIWLLFGDFRADDGLVAYYPEEIEYLKRLPHEEIMRIHRTKKIFPGSKIVS